MRGGIINLPTLTLIMYLLWNIYSMTVAEAVMPAESGQVVVKTIRNIQFDE